MEVHMKKLLLFALLLLITIFLASCAIPGEENAAEDLVATQVSIILTETAIHVVEEPQPTSTQDLSPSPTEPEPEQENTPTPTETSTPTTTPTSTPDQDDPAQRLGAATWTEDFSGSSSPWDYESTQAVFKTDNGTLNLTARANANWHNWWVSSPRLKNAYVETTLQMSACSGVDRVGLAIRASSDGQQFYFVAVTCDGRWGFFRMEEDVNINTILGYQPADPLTAGLAEPHRIGIWMQDSNFTFYINGIEVGSANDTILKDSGFTGFLIAFADTPGFTVQVDKLSYWNVP
jgi:hypothetical protein